MVEKNVGPLSSNPDKTRVLRKRKSRSESDDDLSDINDAEITGYLNNKTEMLFKKLVWEAMNKDYPKKQRKPVIAKKSTSAKNVVASRTVKGKEEEKEHKKRLSSKINYDALEKPTDEPDEVTEKAKKGVIDLNCSNQIETQQSKGTSSLEVCAFEEDNYSDELELENTPLYSYREDEEDEYGYREDYDYEEF
ncbi:uncharacterized protein LOC111281208 isoform X1 [Durio zibethinus]|uniref:Uncharacterized protein LOC111281208 isoform X1 n=1 Tax=Durio zibethinus TaxID=66656 RepID=A0A6P5X9X4_DURZI|nr:uncharacterized protein LOC111281208 isoform X1 [Durio zibethinus]